jgi:hypothetical protein
MISPADADSLRLHFQNDRAMENPKRITLNAKIVVLIGLGMLSYALSTFLTRRNGTSSL